MENREAGGGGPSEAEILRAVPPAVGANEFRVGVFVLLGILGFLTVLFLMTDPATFRGRYMILTHVENASGIRKGDPVQMKGVNVGRVDEFRIRDDGVDITLEIEGEWAIPEDSRANLASSGLLGGVTVEIIRGASARNVGSGGILPGSSGANVMSTVEDLGGQAGTVLTQIESLLSEPTVAALQGSATELHTLLEELSDLTRTQGAEIARLTETLNTTAGSLAEAGPEATASLVEARATMVKLNVAADALGRASSSLDTVLARMASGQGSLGRLSTDDELYTRLSAAAESAQLLLDDIRAHPGRYIKLSVF